MTLGLRSAALPILLTVAVAAAFGGPDRESLLATWEAALRADAETRRLEPLGGGRYSFSTTAFPFDGELEVTEVVIDDRAAESPFGAVTGHVVTELEGIDDEFRRRHATSLGLWQTDSTFMWDADDERWVTASEWSSGLQRSFGGWCAGLGSGLFWIVFLAFAVGLLWLVTRRAQRQMKQAMAQQERALEEQQRAMRMHEEGLELAREGNRLLAAILERLERRNDV